MVAILGCIAVALFLAVIWLGAIIVDRHLRRKWEARLDEHYAYWHEGVDPCGPEDDVPTHMECQH